MSVSCQGETGKTINEKMLDGGCIQRFKVSSILCFVRYSLCNQAINSCLRFRAKVENKLCSS